MYSVVSYLALDCTYYSAFDFVMTAPVIMCGYGVGGFTFFRLSDLGCLWARKWINDFITHSPFYRSVQQYLSTVWPSLLRLPYLLVTRGTRSRETLQLSKQCLILYWRTSCTLNMRWVAAGNASSDKVFSHDSEAVPRSIFSNYVLHAVSISNPQASFKDDARKSMITSTTVREQQTLTRAYKAGIVEHKSHR